MHGCQRWGGRSALALATLLAVLASTSGAGAEPSVPGHLAELSGGSVVPGEVVVKYRRGTTPRRRDAALTAVGAEVERRSYLPRTEVVAVEVGAEADAAAELASDPRVRYAEPNGIVRAQTLPNETRFPELWSLDNQGATVAGLPAVAGADIHASEGWATARGLSTAEPVAVVDSGVAIDHPDLAGSEFRNPGESGSGRETNEIDDDGNGLVDDYRGWDFLLYDNDPHDEFGHGTHISGTLAAQANNGIGIAGVASFPRAGAWARPPILPVRVLNRNGTGSFEAIAAGLAYAGEMGAPVANVSIGGSSTSQVIDDAIASHPQTLYVVAAGNLGMDADSNPRAPCVSVSQQDDAPNKLCVASTNAADELASNSNYGRANVDLAAPGVSVLSSWSESVVWSEDFEGTITDRWETGDPGQAGSLRWGASTLFAMSPTQSATDSPGGTELEPTPYEPNQDNWIRTLAAVDLTDGAECALGADVDIDMQFGPDTLSFEATTTPEVEASWQSFASMTGLFTQRVSFPLPLGLDGGGEVFIRMRVRTDATMQDDGVYVDDLAVVCDGAYNATSYQVHSGTSISAPHVAGAAALLFAAHPGATVAEVKRMILRGVDRLPSLAGKVATGGRLNLYKAAAESSAEVSGGTLTFTAGRGEANDIVVTRFTDPADGKLKYRIRDRYSPDPHGPQTGSRVVPGSGCARDGETAVKCPAGPVLSILIDAGDRDDSVHAHALGVPVRVLSG